jgi:predicted lipoprotein with Yx(FWY)xxD motif
VRIRSIGALTALTLVVGAGAAAAPAAPSSAGVTVKTASVAKLGEVLVNGSGLTLYRFTSDKKGSSSCTGGCASVWSPLFAVGKTSAGTGVAASKLGTIKRSNGRMQVTYAGYPLYLYASDTKSGSDKGEGVGGSWFAVAPSGALVKGSTAVQGAPSTSTGSSSSSSSPPSTPPSTTTTTTSSGGGYNY